MGTTKPYRRTIRQFLDGEISHNSQFVKHVKYAQSPEHYVRAFTLIQKDLLELFNYIEPSDQNLQTYSFRIHELLLRTCVEIEANCVAILTENGYAKSSDLNMSDYKKINASHRLSSYQIMLPIWNGLKFIRTPYLAWQSGGSLSWYRTYNETKHDRHAKFKLATFDNLIESICGLAVILSAQFATTDFGPDKYVTYIGSDKDGFDTAIGDYLRVKFPNDWPDQEKYDFRWDITMVNSADPFQNHNY